MRHSLAARKHFFWYNKVFNPTHGQSMPQRDALEKQLETLKIEHRDLDEVIARLSADPVNQLQIQRLKKRKLVLKDMIAKIESMLLPDIIA